MEISNDELIYRKHADDLLRYATALVGPSDADDVVAAVFVKILNKRSLDSLHEPRLYSFRAVGNEARSVLRKRRSFPSSAPELPVDPPEPLVDVVAALMDLPMQQRAAVYLTYWQGMITKEAAAHIGVRQGTIKRYLFVARKKMKGFLT